MNTTCKCGAAGEIFFQGAVTCLPCRAAVVATRPPLPEVKKTRREVVVRYEEKTYRFRSKAEARRTMRTILQTRRLPSEVSAQI